MTFRATGNGAAPKSPLAWPFQVKMCPQAIQIIEYSLKLPGISARLMERNWPLDLSLSAVLREQCIILTRIEKRECLWMGLTVYTWFLFILYYIYTYIHTWCHSQGVFYLNSITYTPPGCTGCSEVVFKL